LASLIPIQEFIARGLEVELTWKMSLCYAFFLFLIFWVFEYFKKEEFGGAKEKFFFEVNEDRKCKKIR
jgi:hypothetical protein